MCSQYLTSNLHVIILTVHEILQVIYKHVAGFTHRITEFNVYGFAHRNNILVYNSNYMHKSQSLFNLTTALHVSGVTIIHLPEHKTTVTTACGNHYTVLLSAAIHDSSRQYGVMVARCCSYSCFVHLKMGDSDARNM